MFTHSRRNLTWWFTLSMGSILLMFSGVVYYQRVAYQLEAVDRLLYKKARVIAASIEYEETAADFEPINLDKAPLLGNTPPPADTEVFYARWYQPTGQLSHFFGPSPPEQLEQGPAFQTLQWPTDNASNSLSFGSAVTYAPLQLRQITLPVHHQEQVIGYLQMATPMTPVQESLRQTLMGFAITVPITLGVIGLTGWGLSGLAMWPIRKSYQQLQQFTADASHELRTPLATILSNAQVGLLAPGDRTAEKHQRLEKIVTATQSMNKLVSQLLLLARHSDSLNTQTLQTVDLNSLIKNLLESEPICTAAQAITLSATLPDAPVWVEAEPDLLHQAIANVLSNACKYTLEGGWVKISLSKGARSAWIQVADSGIGIPAADLPHIFERFYRVDKQRSKATGGLGLGLAIAQQIVQAHGGDIYVSSELGQGTCFQVELPY
ncbi:HAMP domain-containing histidine kinase [Nodosilinea sp. LEGE 07298]|uniref:sensor histidine kinase n=1 Tax=Nodosilinea sp. LEGE 07298 TaxID=2777970 RepID=UPI00187DF40C|nr:HAMP domain-containing sensor histidine kinase [Nodosilinea sp. LEGE 07298]MBE9110052.1 HAMP domain-containing histidine kinase [Nodosilinea sp. LEGE 07298]